MATEALQSEHPGIRRWRVARLREAGFDDALACALADHRGFDLHELLNLVDRGCPPALAARIVAPLDSDARVP